MQKSDMKKMDVGALNQEVASLRKELFNMKLNRVVEPTKDYSQFKKIRQRIARALTFIHQQEQSGKK